MKQLMIGGQALKTLGSPRHTEDVDYLICNKTDKRAFIHDKKLNVDYVNANGNKFFAAIWKKEAKNIGPLASPQAIFELKAYAVIQHYKNGNLKKAAEGEFDLKWMTKHLNVSTFDTLPGYITPGELAELKKIITE